MVRNACLALLLCAAQGGAATTTELFHDDFSTAEEGSDGFPVWIADSGTWTVRDGAFLGADCAGHFIAQGARTGRAEWTDYTLSLRLRLLSRGSDWRDGPWIGFRYRNRGNAYTLGFYDRMTALHKASRGKVTSDDKELATSPTTIRDGAWHRVAITCKGSAIAVALDGQTIIEATDEGWNDAPPVPSGAIVLSARKHEGGEGTSRVLFDDVRVQALEPVPAELAFTLADARQRAPRRIERISMLEFLKQRRSRRWLRVPRKVLAFYYTWYGRPERHGRWVHWAGVEPEEHEIATSTHYPAKGAYDSHDPAIIDHHIALAKSHGIDAFVATWWGQGTFDDRAFRVLLERAKAHDFEVTVYWEAAPGEGRAKVRRAVDDLVYVLESYGSHPAFLKVEDKPVIFVYGRVMGQMELGEWPQVITGARRRAGEDFLLIADGYREAYARLFDGLHVYNICGWVQGKSPQELAELSRQAFSRAVALAKRHARVACVTIIPGYDDTKIRTPGINAERQGGETYRVLWEQAIAADPDWVVITSWNEWHEGSEIEPSWEHGETYLDITATYARGFKQTPHSQAPVPPGPATVPADQARKLQKLWGSRTIAVLPDFAGDAVFWLADAGLNLQELRWEELLDPEKFAPDRFPVALYAGYESYTQTVREEGDVDDALRRYLRRGGTLAALAAGPFPFFYNQDGEAVAAARRLGFPIRGAGAGGQEAPTIRGWEEPPPGLDLAFRFDVDSLPGLPRQAPFPRAGDLRWRPCSPQGAAEGDLYLPLARLVDAEGRIYGDGIAYIEHRASEPKGGRNLYVWMRMGDGVGASDLYFALFRFLGQRLPR
ncbi:MAG: endo-1,3-alpha-glucanase family glycosylhydrolase [Candidatus Brocadiia bacterium]